MAKYFTLHELTRSSVALAKGIDNTPPPDVKVKLTALMNNCLDPVRELWGKPITVNSGFRCPKLNEAVGGAVNSQHMKGEAADITTGSVDGNRKLFDMIVKSDIPFDQIISESGKNKIPYSWIHISYKPDSNRRNILHM